MGLPADPDQRPYGRRAFLGVVAVGLSSLAWGEAAWRGFSSLLDPVTGRLSGPLGALPSPTGGWRIGHRVRPNLGTAGASVDACLLPLVGRALTFACAPRASDQTARWIRLRGLLERARLNGRPQEERALFSHLGYGYGRD